MDTTWYAVDAAGHVAVFESGENGHAPTTAEEGAIFLQELFWARHPTADRDAYAPDEALALEFGFYAYLCGEGFDPIDVYERLVVPPNPVHVDQLPPDVRRGCKTLRLPFAFAETERFQPMEFFECTYWSEDDRTGFVASDGITVRPLPGKEHLFADMVRRLRLEEPEVAARYRFEGIDETP
jgi:hypothetical protein